MQILPDVRLQRQTMKSIVLICAMQAIGRWLYLKNAQLARTITQNIKKLATKLAPNIS